MLPTDSLEYEILSNAVAEAASVDVNALSCEIGLREGGGSHYMLDALWNSGQLGRTHIAIDPYGNIDYTTSENITTRFDYTNDMRNRCMANLHSHLHTQYSDTLNFLFFPLEDTEFFTRYADGVPIYQEFKRIATHYSTVHFDGPHAAEPLIAEFMFFVPRLLKGSTIVFDDIGNYDHQSFEDTWIAANNFELLEKGSRKASYRYVADFTSTNNG